MRVKDLIEALEEHNPEHDVYCQTFSEGEQIVCRAVVVGAQLATTDDMPTVLLAAEYDS